MTAVTEPVAVTTGPDTTGPGTRAVTREDIAARRARPSPTDRVVFRVAGLYGVSTGTVPFPVSETETIDSGLVSATQDPDAGASGNVGIIDFDRCYLRVKYNAHFVFPGIHELVMSGKHDLSLLGPVRVTATDECTVNDDMTGWHALGTLDFLPGSLWSGAGGG